MNTKSKNVYLIATYYGRPRDPSQTYKSGYIKDDKNIIWDEQVVITLGIKDKDSSAASVILNITEQKVVKNNFNNDREFMKLFEYFYTSSPQEVSQALKRVGITVGENKVADKEMLNTVNEPIQHESQIDVQGTNETSEGSKSAATANPIVTGKSNTRRRRKNNVDSADSATSEGTDQPVKKKSESVTV